MARIVDHILPDGRKIKIKEGSQVIQGEDLDEFYLETVARQLAQAEGKNPDDPRVIDDVKRRISPSAGPPVLVRGGRNGS